MSLQLVRRCDGCGVMLPLRLVPRRGPQVLKLPSSTGNDLCSRCLAREEARL